MNPTSPLNTATAVGAGAVVAPVVSYVASLFHATLPVDVQSAIVVLVVAGAHWLSQMQGARAAAKAPQPATPAA
ncbi:MAG: hypothetical protein JWN43_112 [Gammaproteobacteria bacterium]|nr:hypothetical protein [Gammaproteobacteria bacterium]